MRIYLILLWSVFCFSCNAQEKQKVKLKGTKWECKIAEGCINSYEFKTDSTFIFLSCEMEDEYFGDYYFKDGFLILDQKRSIYYEDLSDSCLHQKERKMYKVEIKEDKLKHLLMSDWVNGKWIQSGFKFDDSYLYKKVE